MGTQAPPRLESAIKAVFAPRLRKDGFRGSGRKFYCEVGPWLNVVTVQGSKWGGSFAVNLGIHFIEAADVVGNPCDPSKMTEANCEFRRRLSADRTEHWWKHEGDEASMFGAVQSAMEMYEKYGPNYFAKAIQALEATTADTLEAGTLDLLGFGGTKSRLGLALARIRRVEGKKEESRLFAEYALQHIGSAKALKPELESLAAI
jgi:hypothetical protein